MLLGEEVVLQRLPELIGLSQEALGHWVDYTPGLLLLDRLLNVLCGVVG